MNEFKTILYVRGDPTSQKVIAGGSVGHTLGVINGFINNGKKVVCAATFMTQEISELKIEALTHLTIPRPFLSLPWRLTCILLNFFHVACILPLFKKYPIDCIYQRYTFFNFIGVLLSKIMKVPLILEFNGSEVWVDKNWGSDRIWGKLTRLASWIEKWNLKKAASIIVVSQVIKDDLIAQGIQQEKILVNPNGVNVNEFDPARLQEDRLIIRKKFGLENKFVFGFVGTFSQWHGIEVMAQMIPEVIKQNPQTHFLFIGQGPLLDFLKAELEKVQVGKDHVTFTGMVPQKEAKKYLAACDAFLSPTQANADGTRFFGSPTKLFEYMSMAKPIIASDLEQLKDIVRPAIKIEDTSDINNNDKAIGVLVEPKDLNGFITAACLLASADIQMLNQLGTNARQRAIEKHTWDAHVASILSFAKHKGIQQ